MSRYEVDNFVTPPDPDLICCICRNVLYKPMESPCQHVFCKDCITTWLTDHRSCPNCRQTLTGAHLKPVLPIVRNMISRLLIKCDNHVRGCNKGIKLEAYERHVKECDYALVGCLNAGCVKNILRKDMVKHERECLHRLVKCKKGCELPITVADMRSHSCIQSLKNSMQAMEDSFNKRLKDLEDRMSRSYYDLEERVYRVEGELDERYNEERRRREEEQWRHHWRGYDGYRSSRSRSHSHSNNHSRSHSRSRSRSPSRSPSRSRSSSRDRSTVSSRSRSPRRDSSPDRRSITPSYESSRSRSRSYDSPYASPVYSISSRSEYEWYDNHWPEDDIDERQEERNEDSPSEPTFSPWDRDDSPGSSSDDRQDPTPVYVSERRTQHTRTRITVFNPPDNRTTETRVTVSTSSSQPANQQQVQNNPEAASTSSASDRAPPLVTGDTPTVSNDERRPESATNQETRPASSQGDEVVSGTLYGVAVGETDSEDSEWQPDTDNANSTSGSNTTSSDEDPVDDGHDLSGDEIPAEPVTSGRKTASRKRKRQGEEPESHSADRPGTSRRSAGEDVAVARYTQREESQTAEPSTSNRRRNPSQDASEPGDRQSIKKKRRK